MKAIMNKPSPFSGRRKARRYALQALYGWMLSDNPLHDVETYILLEHAEDNFDQEYFKILLHQIPTQVESIEVIMLPFLTRKLEDLGPIELTILRISIFELKERLDIPYRVIINEGLELAKTFGSPDSHKFINGVLDKVARVIRTSEL